MPIAAPDPMTIDSDFPLSSAPTTAPALSPAIVAPSRSAAVRKPWLDGMRVRDAVFQKLLVCADLLAAAAGVAVLAALGGHGLAVASLWTIPLIVVLAKMSGRYGHDEMTLRKSTLEELPALVVLAGANALAWSVIALVANVHMSLRGGGVVVLWLTTAVALPVFRMGARKLGALAAPHERVLIVGNAASRALLASSLGTDPAARLEVVGFLPLEDERRVETDWGDRSRRRRTRTFADLGTVVAELDVHRVFLIPTNADGETILEAVRRASRLGIRVSLVPRLFEVVGSAVAFDMVGGVTVLGVRPPGLSRAARLTKRTMDVCGSALCLFVLAPLMAIIAVAIKLDSPGPIFFRQLRVGRDGETFGILKFRSMTADAEAQRALLESLNETSGNFKLTADPRVTRVGRLLRACSIDELPQLINVLRGEMSLVGPRPLILAEDSLIEGRHRDRLHLAPGITGPWQVLGPARPPLSEMVKTDYLYAVNWSVWSDIKLVLRTLAHVAARRGL
jgi:exopolysaccharide biosynthesis polyprenyl glycosylphosphotransferase